MSIKEKNTWMNACYNEFEYYPKTVAEFAAYINYVESRADEESALNTPTT